jgi:23S rRNA pseudouridine2605 synthase
MRITTMPQRSVPEKVYLMLNKPRGYHHGQRRYAGHSVCAAVLPAFRTVGRPDKASEGLCRSRTTVRGGRLTDPASHIDKTYHVQIDALPDTALLQRLQAGIDDGGERLSANSVRELRRGERNAWLEIVLDEGRNRQIRRLLATFHIEVLRLVRVATGPLLLGDLAKGKWRMLSAAEVAIHARHSGAPRNPA